jgi:signal transduction histidine kinase
VPESAKSASQGDAPVATLLRAQERERSRIAAEIHDDSIPAMCAVALRLEMLAPAVDSGPQREAFMQLAREVAEAVRRLRRSIFDLTPPALEHGGLANAIEAYLDEVGSAAGFDWRVDAEPPDGFAGEANVILYRIAQEAIRNAEKHAHARNVTVVLRRSGAGTLLRVTDDGVGFQADAPGSRPVPGHIGLSAMHERASAAGGRLSIASAPGAGCMVEAWVPHLVTFKQLRKVLSQP